MIATDGQRGRRKAKQELFHVICGRNVLSAQMLDMFLVGVGTVLRLERDAW